MGVHKARAKTCLIAAVMSLLLLSSCDGQGVKEASPALCVAQWNVQNLFNAVLDGGEYEEYKPESGWSSENYEKRLSNVRKVLGYLPECEDYIIVLNEIECPSVAEDIINSADIVNMGLHYYVCTDQADMAVETAVLSSVPIESACVHHVDEGLRPVLEVQLSVGSDKVIVLAVHFKSNVGGVDATASDRMKAALVVSQISRQLERENPGCMILVCGDMNEECWDERCMGRSRDCTSPLKVSDAFQQGFWQCFWLDGSLSLWPNGSYLYEGQWRCYDNILASLAAGDRTGLDLVDAGVVFKGIVKTADSKPFAWDRNLLTGVSDHIPVWIVLSYH